VSAPTFDFQVMPAPENYEPERTPPGRTRAPSPFDQTLVDLKDKGWQRVPFSTKEEKELILKELHRAKAFNGLGLDLNENDEEGFVEFKSRDLQKRRPRKKKGDIAEDGTVVTEDEPDTEGEEDSENGEE
jgi:hypothetical protein